MEQYFDKITLECTNFLGLSQIIASLTRGSMVVICLGHRLKRTKHWPNVDAVSVLGVPRDRGSRSTQLQTRKVALDDADESGARLCSYCLSEAQRGTADKDRFCPFVRLSFWPSSRDVG